MPQQRTILITGVSRGLGRALALKFAASGHVVVGCGRSAEALAALRREIGKQGHFQVVDVASDRQVAHWAQKVIDTVGAPDLLLNNAALINRNAPLWQVPAAEFSDVIDVNIKGVANVLRHFLPAMVARKSGVIVNFSSGWGRATDAEVAPYCATKWAIEGMTRALAQELPRGMAAVPLNPGIIDTAMLRSCFGADAGHYPTADEWAETAAPFLLRLGAADNGKALTAPGG
ncbi:SDR family oxidoreductase [Sulfurisoma sediminicola]|uniref:NADP-dependent 3-hydroxy acid dehydrogenase YdfG n=1 Tax=Sulfurisoma sediminicola TaxID=1381557 RepID=A0A497XFE1_9PROT|nr:SDR family oxidoreductase [Sulfurisoma sediminicola]RLJ64848.1 NADP-dependent 3-hydroxy acid dehydrogenase YdfG [Sulfurisoma sediminicola]